jgi:hypothetical protein
MEIKHIRYSYRIAPAPLPVLEITVLPGETYEQAIIRVKKDQQVALEAAQETEKCVS